MLGAVRRFLFGEGLPNIRLPALPNGTRLALSELPFRRDSDVFLVGGAIWPIAEHMCEHLLQQRKYLFGVEGRSTLEVWPVAVDDGR